MLRGLGTWRGRVQGGRVQGAGGTLLSPITNYQLSITNAQCPMPHAPPINISNLF